MKTIVIIGITFFCNYCLAQDFVYKARNPNFGGDSFNYQWLLSSADSQNLYKDPEEQNLNRLASGQDKFKDNLSNQLLSQISRSLVQQQLGGSSGLNPGVYTLGNLSVEIFNSNLGLVINILDILTGEQSQVIIPRR